MLRKLKKEDAPFMLEWMLDPDVTKWMNADFASKTMEDCLGFIENSETETDIHRAIADSETDEYMGTVSLKHINREKNIAEFAITIRKKAMGKGYSKKAMAEIIQYGIMELGLETIYWYVNSSNNRALRFYDKNGYQRVDNLPIEGMDGCNYVFFCVQKDNKNL